MIYVAAIARQATRMIILCFDLGSRSTKEAGSKGQLHGGPVVSIHLHAYSTMRIILYHPRLMSNGPTFFSVMAMTEAPC
jgi:hypothetical protein